ncbi:hypothetical protein CPB84DRAFT_1748745 [Gymnopilus junonius]|uniref:Uncharacterized protein n=1 Tax=Gymnopilus junonius TaxID=109634 RepID=A0A9P5TKG9_GYMJU|nr:hypothetical protein CPB84DRAFT_1748745 [Gymnopilus junonius]
MTEDLSKRDFPLYESPFNVGFPFQRRKKRGNLMDPAELQSTRESTMKRIAWLLAAHESNEEKIVLLLGTPDEDATLKQKEALAKLMGFTLDDVLIVEIID